MAHEPKGTRLYGEGDNYVWATVCIRCGHLVGDGYHYYPCPADEKPAAKAEQEPIGVHRTTIKWPRLEDADELRDLRYKALVWLGYWRDKFPNEAVASLQDILGVPRGER